jgi:hypothetical protein
MKRYSIILDVILLFAGNLFAQNEPYKQTFVSYTDYFSKEYGITCKMPEEFTDLNQYLVGMRIREDTAKIGAAFVIGPILRSKDKDCLVGYPATVFYMTKEEVEFRNRYDADVPRWLRPGNNTDIARSTIIHEVKASLGFPLELPDDPSKDTDTVKRIVPFLYDTTQIDFDKYVTVIAGEKAREMFNADSIFLYDLPLQKSYEGKYPYCMGMALNKKDRATMMFKLFFTPEGKEIEDKYINMLSKKVWYDEDFRAR